MKKIVALFMVCAVALSISASAKCKSQLLFQRWQFQLHCDQESDYVGYPILTFPLVYTGSVKFAGWKVDTDLLEACATDYCLTDEKISPSLFMTICQPCIECFPCTLVPKEAGVIREIPDLASLNDTTMPAITAWNLYVVVPFGSGKNKAVYIRKIDLADTGADASFWTGPKKGSAVVQYKAAGGGYNGDTDVQFFIGGKKSDYSFSFVESFAYWKDSSDHSKGLFWADPGSSAKSQKGYVKSVDKFSGSLVYSEGVNDNNFPGPSVAIENYGYSVNGTVSLSRDSKLTKMAVNAVFGTVCSKAKHWEDCGTPDPDYCEKYFASGADDAFDDYLYEEAYKKYHQVWSIYNPDLTDLYEDIYATVFYELKGMTIDITTSDGYNNVNLK